MSLLDRDEVPEPKSLASTRPADRPRVAASSATPTPTPPPTTPPPTTSTCCSVLVSAVSAAARSSGPSFAVAPAPAITVRTLPAALPPAAHQYCGSGPGPGPVSLAARQLGASGRRPVAGPARRSR